MPSLHFTSERGHAFTSLLREGMPCCVCVNTYEQISYVALGLTMRACVAPRQMARWFPDPLYDTPSMECLSRKEKRRKEKRWKDENKVEKSNCGEIES